MQQSVTSIQPILIDALHINMGGALMILNHLVNRLVTRNVNFVLLKDERCPKLRSERSIPEIVVMSSGERLRRRYYKSHRESFSAVLCLGNIPPAIKMPVPVHTYIHNVSLLEIPSAYPLMWKVKNYLKREYIKSLYKNTNTWIVQTDNTLELVKKYLPHKGKQLLQYPFYYIPPQIKEKSSKERGDYVFVGEHTYAKGHEYLIEAWAKLAQKGFKRRLHLTVTSPDLRDRIKKYQDNGVNIINHGRIAFKDVLGLYQVSKATIYPSLNESLGLGIIEAAEAGCDVIGCDLPYIYSVCSPSETFRPQSADAIVEAVLKYEMGQSPKTKLTIRDMADELIEFLTK